MNEKAQKFRRWQNMGTIAVPILFFIATYVWSDTRNMLGVIAWTIMGLGAMMIIVSMLKAAKLEVLTTMGVSSDTYLLMRERGEQLIIRKESLKKRRSM
jgi:hypothetical protein